MKKPIFTASLAALAALMLTGCTSRHEAVNGSKVTASPDIAQMQTANPTAEPTAEPTALPTEAPSEEPNPYCMEEYEQLLKFFEIADENGVKNGEKCFKNYDPTRVEFWGTERGDSDDSWLFWDENGYLTKIYLCGTEDELIMLSGEFKVHGFDMLETISVNEYVTFESSDIKGGGNLDHAYIRTKADATIVGDYFDFFKVTSEGKCHFESSGRRADLDEPEIGYAFNVDLTAEGSGSVEVSGWLDEHYYYAVVCAVPTEGHKFLGWHDAEGNLISEKAVIAIAFDANYESDVEVAYIFDRNFTGIAKFE